MNLNLISYDVYLVYFNRYRGGMARREDCTRGRYGFVGELDSGYYRRSAGWLFGVMGIWTTGIIGSLVTATVGAIVLLAIVSLLSKRSS